MNIKNWYKILTISIIVIMIAMTALVFYTDVFIIEDDALASTIKQGATGTMVTTIQTKLSNWGYYSGAIDGIFGSQTTAAVKYFQKTNGLTVDGIVGTQTAAALGISLTSSSSSTSTTSDTYLLARLIYGEARGESYIGQVAVAAVVLNRVASSQFPNTLSGVIYQPWAFTVVNDGQINLTPDATALKAAADALAGWDPTYGCLFYYNPDTATSSWIRQLEIKVTIGSHVFCA